MVVSVLWGTSSMEFGLFFLHSTPKNHQIALFCALVTADFAVMAFPLAFLVYDTFLLFALSIQFYIFV